MTRTLTYCPGCGDHLDLHPGPPWQPCPELADHLRTLHGLRSELANLAQGLESSRLTRCVAACDQLLRQLGVDPDAPLPAPPTLADLEK